MSSAIPSGVDFTSVRRRVVDVNALRALAPSRLRPRAQAITPPAPHTAAPLEPQAQRTLASGAPTVPARL